MLAGHDIGQFVRSWSGQPHGRACIAASLPGIWWLHRRQTQPGVGTRTRSGACLTPVGLIKTCAPRAPPVLAASSRKPPRSATTHARSAR